MNASLQALSGYKKSKTTIKTPRSIEAQLLGEVTADLKKAGNGKFRALVEVLHRNQMMWTTFATNIADKENQLPAMLRAQIFYLAEFTEHHTQKVLRKEADVAPLIDINMSILKGLSATGVRK